MKEPTRLRDAKSPHARAARDLLRGAEGGRASGSGFRMRGMAGPSLEQRDAMWATIAASIGPGAPSPSGGGDQGGGDQGGGGGGAAADLSGAATGAESVGTASAGAATAASRASAAKLASASTAAKTASVSTAAKIVAATATAAPAGKVGLALGAARVWIALGIGAVGAAGAVTYVGSPAREPAALVAPTAAPADLAGSASRVKPRDEAAYDSPDRGETGAPSPRPSLAPDGQAAPAQEASLARVEAPKPEGEPKRPASSRSIAASTPDAVPAPAATEPPADAPTTPLTPTERASRLRDEAKATADARVALRSGDAAGALRLLADAAKTYGGGGMGQEREALTIEALARSGAREAASSRADAFLARWPNSTHAAAVRPFAHGSISK